MASGHPGAHGALVRWHVVVVSLFEHEHVMILSHPMGVRIVWAPPSKSTSAICRNVKASTVISLSSTWRAACYHSGTCGGQICGGLHGWPAQGSRQVWAPFHTLLPIVRTLPPDTKLFDMYFFPVRWMWTVQGMELWLLSTPVLLWRE